jgi:hypothetical protein
MVEGKTSFTAKLETVIFPHAVLQMGHGGLYPVSIKN